jgi:hypothetical protein
MGLREVAQAAHLSLTEIAVPGSPEIAPRECVLVGLEGMLQHPLKAH